MTAEVKLSPIHALGVLRKAPFRRYVIGSLISDTGSWMQVMAQGWVMATLTDKAIWLGMANLAAGLPMLLLTIISREAVGMIVASCQLSVASTWPAALATDNWQLATINSSSRPDISAKQCAY